MSVLSLSKIFINLWQITNVLIYLLKNAFIFLPYWKNLFLIFLLSVYDQYVRADNGWSTNSGTFLLCVHICFHCPVQYWQKSQARCTDAAFSIQSSEKPIATVDQLSSVHTNVPITSFASFLTFLSDVFYTSRLNCYLLCWHCTLQFQSSALPNFKHCFPLHYQIALFTNFFFFFAKPLLLLLLFWLFLLFAISILHG